MRMRPPFSITAAVTSIMALNIVAIPAGLAKTTPAGVSCLRRERLPLRRKRLLMPKSGLGGRGLRPSPSPGRGGPRGFPFSSFYRRSRNVFRSFPSAAAGRTGSVSIREARRAGVRVFFIENDYYFNQASHGTVEGDDPENGERFGFFPRSILDALRSWIFPRTSSTPTTGRRALIFAYRKFNGGDPLFRPAGGVFTIHNLAYQGVFEPDILGRVGSSTAVPDGRSRIPRKGQLEGRPSTPTRSRLSPRTPGKSRRREFGCA